MGHTYGWDTNVTGLPSTMTHAWERYLFGPGYIGKRAVPCTAMGQTFYGM